MVVGITGSAPGVLFGSQCANFHLSTETVFPLPHISSLKYLAMLCG